MQLVGGDAVSRGRVEYCYNGTWYSLCADNWEHMAEEASTIYEAMGYNTSHYC